MKDFIEVIQRYDNKRVLIPSDKIMCINAQDSGVEIVLGVFPKKVYIVQTVDSYEEIKLQLEN